MRSSFRQALFPILLFAVLAFALFVGVASAAAKSASPYTSISFRDEDVLIDVEAHDYGIHATNLNIGPARMTILDDRGNVEHSWEPKEGFVGFDNHRARTLVFRMEGQGAFALANPVLANDFGRPQATNTTWVDGAMAWSVYRNSEHTCIRISSTEPVGMVVRDGNWSVLAEAQSKTHLEMEVDDRDTFKIVFVTSTVPAPVTASVDADRCDSPRARGGADEGDTPGTSVTTAALVAAGVASALSVRRRRRR